MITATVLDITNEIEREGWRSEKYTYTNRHTHCTDTKARLGCMYGERDGIAHSTASKTFSYFSSTRSCFFLCMKSDVCLLKNMHLDVIIQFIFVTNVYSYSKYILNKNFFEEILYIYFKYFACHTFKFKPLSKFKVICPYFRYKF